VGRVPVGPDPAGVAVSPDGKLVFVANRNSGGKSRPDGDSISVVDVAAAKEVRRIEVGNGARPHDIRMVGGKVYFTAEGYRAVGRVDPDRNKVDWTVGLGQKGPTMLAVSRSGNTIVAANADSDNVSVVDGVVKGPSAWEITLLPVGKSPEGVDISPDDKEAWASNEEAGGISIIDLAKKAVIQQLGLQTTHANRLRFTPDGKRVLLADRHTAELVVVDGASRKLIKKVKLPDGVAMSATNRNQIYDFTVTPDSARAFVSVNGPAGHSYIGEIDLSTLELTRRIETGASGDCMAWVVTR
jgi:DNA-binding beta-propeller fold protein YncE